MITVRVYSATGQRRADAHLPMSRSDVAVKMLRRIAKGGSEFDGDDLADLDNGRLKFGTLAKLFTRKELTTAVRARLSDESISETERGELLALLDDRSLWSAAQGGEQAGNRFSIKDYDAPRADHRDRFGDGASRGESGELRGRSRPPGKGIMSPLAPKATSDSIDPMRKSQEVIALTDLVKSHNWQVKESLHDGGLLFLHDAFQGHALGLHPDGSWQHDAAGKTIAAGAAGLRQHLKIFHRDY
jgi:hypothetical protein